MCEAIHQILFINLQCIFFAGRAICISKLISRLRSPISATSCPLRRHSWLVKSTLSIYIITLESTEEKQRFKKVDLKYPAPKLYKAKAPYLLQDFRNNPSIVLSYRIHIWGIFHPRIAQTFFKKQRRQKKHYHSIQTQILPNKVWKGWYFNIGEKNTRRDDPNKKYWSELQAEKDIGETRFTVNPSSIRSNNKTIFRLVK